MSFALHVAISPKMSRADSRHATVTPLYHNTAFLFGVMLLGAIISRFALVVEGGQYYFPDESRYDRGIQLYLSFRSGDFPRVLEMSMLPDHMLFTWLSAGITAVHHGIASMIGKGDWLSHPENIFSTNLIGAAALSLFSAFNVALVYKIARRLGAGAGEALWSMLLMSVAQAVSYHARHFVPYESAIFVALLAWYVGTSAPTLWRLFTGGTLAGLSYGLYNGYWFMPPVIWLALVNHGWPDPRRVRLSVAAGAGALTGVIVPVAYGWFVGGRSFLNRMVGFSQTVNQGSFAEGWSLPWEYLWHTEGVVGACVILAIVGAMAQAYWTRGFTSRIRVVGIMLLAAYGLLVLFSNGLHVFVVYARTVKPLVPLICLLGGWALVRIVPTRFALQLTVVAAFLTHGALQFSSNLYRVFPREFEHAIVRDWGNPLRTVSIEGPFVSPPSSTVNRPDLVLVNAQSLYPVLGDRGYPPGKVILRIPHPLQSPSFQYDGYDPSARAILRTADVSMQLISLRTLTPGETAR